MSRAEKKREKLHQKRKAMTLRPPLGPPDELFKVNSTFSVAQTATTASVELPITINGLLLSGTSLTIGQPTMLANVAKNYSAYRVEKFSVRYNLYSRSSSFYTVIVFPLSEDPAYSSGSSLSIAAGAYPNAHYNIVPANTTSPCHVLNRSMSHSIRSIVGSNEVATDDNYAGTVNTSGVFSDPAKPVYLIFYTGPTAGGSMVAGEAPRITGTITSWVRFYDKRY